MTQLRVSPEARDDLDAIWDYLADVRGVKTADRVTARISATYERLAAFPESGRDCTDFGAGIRFTVVKPYLIFYRPGSDGVEILRVIHGARNLRRAFRQPPGP
jgi:toxin ParE1/3/4